VGNAEVPRVGDATKISWAGDTGVVVRAS
jgi:hypothetical protein